MLFGSLIGDFIAGLFFIAGIWLAWLVTRRNGFLSPWQHIPNTACAQLAVFSFSIHPVGVDSVSWPRPRQRGRGLCGQNSIGISTSQPRSLSGIRVGR